MVSSCLGPLLGGEDCLGMGTSKLLEEIEIFCLDWDGQEYIFVQPYMLKIAIF